jgi:hypothetical protein
MPTLAEGLSQVINIGIVQELGCPVKLRGKKPGDTPRLTKACSLLADIIKAESF